MTDDELIAIEAIEPERDPYSGRHIVILWMTDRDALLAEVRRLRADNVRILLERSEQTSLAETFRAERDAAVAEAQRLRAVRDAAEYVAAAHIKDNDAAALWDALGVLIARLDEVDD